MNPIQARKAGQGQQPVAEVARRRPVPAGLMLWGYCLLIGLGVSGVLSSQPSPLAAQSEDPAQRRIGQLIKIPAPVTDSVTSRAIRQAKDFISQAKKRQEWPVVVFEIEPGPSSFGACLDLAREITKLSGATTVAYVAPRDTRPDAGDDEGPVLRGHALLIAIACEMIVMPTKSKIGEAGADEETIPPYMKSGYSEIAKSRRTVSVDLVLGMLDPALEVYEARTADLVGREFVLGDRLEELRREKQVERNPTLLIPAGEAGLFPAQEAKRLGIVDYYSDDRTNLAKVLNVPPESLVEDPSLGDGWKPVEVEIKEPLTANYLSQIENKIRQEIERGANLIILTIDTPGGAPHQTLKLASYLSELKPGEQRTVAYIPREALGDGAFLALACDHVLMGPHATLGGAVPFPAPEPFMGRNAGQQQRVRPEDRREAEIAAVAQVVEKIARNKNRSASLWQAIVDPDLAVFRYVRESDGMVDYLSETEAESRSNGPWQQHEAVTQHGKPLEVKGEEALRLGMATDVVNRFEEVLALYGLEEPPRKVSPSWADVLLDALRDKRVLWALLLIGGAALYAELQTPGTGIGGFIATVCFLLFFWGNYLDGRSGWLEVLLFIAGMTFLLLEIFVLPGLGIFGVGGGLLVMLALILAMQTSNALPTTAEQIRELRGSLFLISTAGLGVLLMVAVLRRYLPRTGAFQRLVLAPGEDDPELAAPKEDHDHFHHLLGTRGVAVTNLRPSGKVRIGDEIFSVVSSGEPISQGEDVIVVEVLGHRIVVQSPDD